MPLDKYMWFPITETMSSRNPEPQASYKIGAFRRFKLSDLESWARNTGNGFGLKNDPLPGQQGAEVVES